MGSELTYRGSQIWYGETDVGSISLSQTVDRAGTWKVTCWPDRDQAGAVIASAWDVENALEEAAQFIKLAARIWKAV